MQLGVHKKSTTILKKQTPLALYIATELLFKRFYIAIY